MFTRTYQIVALVAACLLALLGILFLLAMLMIWAVAAALTGGIVSIWCHILAPEAGTAVRVGAVVAAATMPPA